MPPRDNGQEEPVIRDNRKIDPETGQVRESVPADQTAEQPAAQATPQAAAGNGELEIQLAERTADLQRLQAEYVNYRRRVERDRAAVREQAVAGALTELLPVLDDIGRARDHGELTGGFAKVAESLESALTKLGLSAFGQKGEPFDPTVHEALMHSYSSDVSEPTAVEVLQPGYRMGDRVLRPARVAVAEPGDLPVASDDEVDN
ncbi:nucleotide exchange factor GrpE [Nonomuraea sp. MG754425]|uniref:nucleotide exchange factor GrpE n=1 Tax=Nonomuraea sp. MG754425 TaxID=2570319 RepID=UPI001F021674|nr:nucleotide exchange factor GrpE [Nonomuraea sp. MG754425]MCF6471049.1 nucleotide exchange factor GrpE [Nonomuraea sp. MG754425]